MNDKTEIKLRQQTHRQVSPELQAINFVFSFITPYTKVFLGDLIRIDMNNSFMLKTIRKKIRIK